MLFEIRTEADYQATLKCAEVLFDAAEEPDPNSEEGAYFQALIAGIAGYEVQHTPLAR